MAAWRRARASRAFERERPFVLPAVPVHRRRTARAPGDAAQGRHRVAGDGGVRGGGRGHGDSAVDAGRGSWASRSGVALSGVVALFPSMGCHWGSVLRHQCVTSPSQPQCHRAGTLSWLGIPPGHVCRSDGCRSLLTGGNAPARSSLPSRTRVSAELYRWPSERDSSAKLRLPALSVDPP